jgi:hypothetical protein
MKKLFTFMLLGLVVGCNNPTTPPPTTPNPKLEIQVTPAPAPIPDPPPPPPAIPPAYSKQFMIGYWDGYYGRGQWHVNYDYRRGYYTGHRDRVNGIQRFKP